MDRYKNEKGITLVALAITITPVPRACVVEARYSGYSSDQTITEDVIL